MVDHGFFEISKEQSRVKAVIVTKYFLAWANVMMSSKIGTPEIMVTALPIWSSKSNGCRMLAGLYSKEGTLPAS